MPPEAPAEPADDKGKVAFLLEQLKNWTVFGLAEAGVVEQANGRTKDTIGITRRCEERNEKAVKRAKPKFLGVF